MFYFKSDILLFFSLFSVEQAVGELSSPNYWLGVPANLLWPPAISPPKSAGNVVNPAP